MKNGNDNLNGNIIAADVDRGKNLGKRLASLLGHDGSAFDSDTEENESRQTLKVLQTGESSRVSCPFQWELTISVTR
jgi:hypothetical protein